MGELADLLTSICQTRDGMNSIKDAGKVKGQTKRRRRNFLELRL